MKTVNARILHAALRLFAEKGSRQIAISDLAKEAGLSRGTIYNNIENPDDLFSILCDLMYLELRQTARATDTDVTDPAARLALILRKIIRRVHEERHAFAIPIDASAVNLSECGVPYEAGAA